VERYIPEEAIEFCSEYIEKAKPVGLPESRHEERVRGKGSRHLGAMDEDVQEVLGASPKYCLIVTSTPTTRT